MIACHECDLLLRETAVPHGGKALCRRCGATLYRSQRQNVERSLAFALGGVVLFGIASAYPIVSLETTGQRVSATLLGAVRALYENGE